MASTVTIEELRLFHKIDRELFSRLVINLFLDPIASMQIIALWLWFEQVGFVDLVMKMLVLDDTEVKMMAEEALLCLYCLSSISPPISTIINNIPMTQNLLGKPISLQYIFENKAQAIFEITKTVNHVCMRAFSDIAQEALATAAQNNDQQQEADSGVVVPDQYLRVGNIMMTPAPVSHGPGLVRLLYRPVITVVPAPPAAFPSVWPLGVGLVPPQQQNFESIDMSSLSLSAASNLNPQALPYSPQPFINPNEGTNINNNEVQRNINDEIPVPIPDNGRTMFLTFSRGYQLTERELHDFFTRRYGDCIEDIIMEEVEANKQPLFARMILDSPAKIVEILNGNDKIRFMINGKHVNARRYVAQQQGGQRPPRSAAGPRGGRGAAVQE